MCGIAGKVNWNNMRGSDVIGGMCEKMKHRGPDDNGIVYLKNAVLGHRRLSIIDLSVSARQPMSSSDGRYYIVYNGEVYNFREIRAELETLGLNFKTKSDTEVILYAYMQWGPECLNKFNGMFAFAVWDDLRKELFLARDRFGKKPLYYHIGAGEVTFASELGALMMDDGISKTVSYEALNSYLALGYILSPMTLYKDIFKLEQATYMLISDYGKSVIKNCYWDYAGEFGNKVKTGKEEIAANLLNLLDEAVKRRLAGDVPIGAFLSGGIDSSSVSKIMMKYHRGDLHTFSVGFDQESYNEINSAGRAAKWIGTIHHSMVCKSSLSQKMIDEAMEAYDEPFSDTSMIPTFALAKFTAKHVKVALSGDGADEIFAGYITYKADRYYFYARLLPLFMRKFLVKFGVNEHRSRQKKLGFAYKQKQFFRGTLDSPEKAHFLWRIIFSPEERINILGEDKRELVYDTDPFLTFKKYYKKVKELHWLDQSLYVDAMTWLADDILVKVDRASMRNSLEVRCPYLDIDLVKYAASIPADFKMAGLETKYILKKALRGTLPDFILKKKKSGFNAPVGAWLGFNGLDEFKFFNQYIFDKKSNVWSS